MDGLKQERQSLLINFIQRNLFLRQLSVQEELGTYKVRNEIETKRNETKRNQRKQNEID